MNKKEKHKTKIGGQALIEGIMMRGINSASMSVRGKDGEIITETWSIKGGTQSPWYTKTPFIRGSINFVTSLVDGYKCITKSAKMSGMMDEEEGEELSKFEKKLNDLFGDKLYGIIMVIAMIFSVALAMGLFMYLPSLIVSSIDKYLFNIGGFRTLCEGLIKIAIFIGYLALTSKMKDIKRTYEYHGAEHKTIACYEAEEELTVENIRQFTRFHPRCGTSFILIVLVVGILVYSLLSWDNLILRVLFRILLLPVVIGIAYEIIRLAGRHNNIFTRIISAPGLALQRLTTREPDDSQIEVAIAAITPVLPVNKEEDKW